MKGRFHPRQILRALLLVLVLAPALLAHPVRAASDVAALMADRVEIDAEGRLVAEGAVEVSFGGWQLRAPRVIYDPATHQIALDGPLHLSDPEGRITVLADAGELSDNLRDGLLRGAQLVLENRMRINAETLTRSEGRYSRMQAAQASSCRVCAGRAPLWEIRAARVSHDTETRRIDFYDAQLRIADVPILWLPRLRLPDPGVERAQGFLRPRLRSNSTLGLGAEVSYFVPIGESRDLTFTPFFSSRDTGLLGLRYRQAYETGTLALSGTMGIGQGEGVRGRAQLDAGFGLPAGFGLQVQASAVSDRRVLSEFGISGSDRVESRATIARVRHEALLEARLVHLESLRDLAIDDTRRATVLDGQWYRRLPLPVEYGAAQFRLESYAIRRVAGRTEADISGLGRLSALAQWRADRVVGPGVVLAAQAQAAADLYRIAPEDTRARNATRLAPSGALEMRWPLIRPLADAAGHDVLEPVVQIAGGRLGASGDVPNDDSLMPELDEGNLFAFSRFPGADRREAGPRMNLGLGWARTADDGSVRRLVLGRVVRDADGADYGGDAAEPGLPSAWLLAGRLEGWNGVNAAARGVFEDGRALDRADMRLGYRLLGAHDLSAAWTWTRGDPGATDPLQQGDISELVTEARLALRPGLVASGTGRFDMTAQEPTYAGLRLGYSNECLALDLSLSRRLSTSTTLASDTEFSLMVELLGFGNRRGGPVRGCQG